VSDPDQLAASAIDHDLIVVDVVPPPRTLPEMCRELRAVSELAGVPILVVTSADDVEERIHLLEAGADDVMVRPVDERELDARVEALEVRRRRSQELRAPSSRRPGDPGGA
jgi:DNA-binding response OmpR family regulator